MASSEASGVDSASPTPILVMPTAQRPVSLIVKRTSMKPASRFIDTVPKDLLASLSSQELRRQEIIHEIIESEKQYVTNLKILIDIFFHPLQENQLLSKQELGRVFSNIDAILPVNMNIYTQLVQRKEQSQMLEEIGDIFLNQASMFRLYAVYCGGQHAIPRFVKELQESKPSFKQFLDSCAIRPQCRGLLMSDFLIEPMQRLCKYPLLFDNLMAVTPKEHKDYQQLFEANNRIKDIVSLINERARQVENADKLLAIQTRFEKPNEVDLIHPRRTHMRDSRMFVEKNGKILKDHFELFLFHDLLLLAKERTSKKNLLKVRFRAHLNTIAIKDTFDPPLNSDTFEITVEGKETYRLRALSEKDRKGWVAIIKRTQRSYLAELELRLVQDTQLLKAEQSRRRKQESTDDSVLGQQSIPKLSVRHRSTTTSMAILSPERKTSLNHKSPIPRVAVDVRSRAGTPTVGSGSNSGRESSNSGRESSSGSSLSARVNLTKYTSEAKLRNDRRENFRTFVDTAKDDRERLELLTQLLEEEVNATSQLREVLLNTIRKNNELEENLRVARLQLESFENRFKGLNEERIARQMAAEEDEDEEKSNQRRSDQRGLAGLLDPNMIRTSPSEPNLIRSRHRKRDSSRNNLAAHLSEADPAPKPHRHQSNIAILVSPPPQSSPALSLAPAATVKRKRSSDDIDKGSLSDSGGRSGELRSSKDLKRSLPRDVARELRDSAEKHERSRSRERLRDHESEPDDQQQQHAAATAARTSSAGSSKAKERLAKDRHRAHCSSDQLLDGHRNSKVRRSKLQTSSVSDLERASSSTMPSCADPAPSTIDPAPAGEHANGTAVGGDQPKTADNEPPLPSSAVDQQSATIDTPPVVSSPAVELSESQAAATDQQPTPAVQEPPAPAVQEPPAPAAQEPPAPAPAPVASAGPAPVTVAAAEASAGSQPAEAAGDRTPFSQALSSGDQTELQSLREENRRLRADLERVRVATNDEQVQRLTRENRELSERLRRVQVLFRSLNTEAVGQSTMTARMKELMVEGNRVSHAVEYFENAIQSLTEKSFRPSSESRRISRKVISVADLNLPPDQRQRRDDEDATAGEPLFSPKSPTSQQ